MSEDAQPNRHLSFPLRLGAWADALRTVPLGQIVARLSRRARQRLLYPLAAERLFPAPAALPDLPDGQVVQGGETPRTDERIERADRIAAGELTFLNLSSDSPFAPAVWDAPPQGSRLWHETLHYGEWALDLATALKITNHETYRKALFARMDSWLDHNPIGKEPAWSPYAIARRLVAWTRVYFLLAPDIEWRPFWRRRLEPSLRRQASFLSANLEHDVPNNHLLADYRALAWAGLSFPHWPEAERWRERGLAGLWREMGRQVLADGVHFERSISYHTLVLQDLLETWCLARRKGVEVPEDVQPTLVRMMRFLFGTRAPDGTWPMVNDTVPGYPMDPADLLALGSCVLGDDALHAGTPPSAFPDSGYVVLRDGRDGYLMFDAGPMGPKAIPGHGHADALSFVLYGGGRPLIVDPGVYTYDEGRWRDHFRSTRAHNTISVDGEDPCLFWGAFRVAHQPDVRLVESSEDQAVGVHDGYKRWARPLAHRRRVTRRRDGQWEVIDQLDGRGKHDYVSTLQFAPGAEAEVGPAGCVVGWDDAVTLHARISGPPEARSRIQAGWVSSDWNKKQEAPRLVLSWCASGPSTVRLILEVQARGV